MATRKQIKERSIERVRRERAPIPWRYFLLSITCAVILAVGFFYAAKQHFAAVDYSMRNSEMRKAKEKLEAEQRKLWVEREWASSRPTIEKAALKMGLKNLDSQDFQFIDPAGNAAVADNSKKPLDNKAGAATAGEPNPAANRADGKTAAAKLEAGNKKDQAAASGKKDIAKLITRDTGKLTVARK